MRIQALFAVLLFAFSVSATKLSVQEKKLNGTGNSISPLEKKSNLPSKDLNSTLTAKSNVQDAPQQAKRTVPAAGHHLHKLAKNASLTASQRQLKLENFVDSHKGAIVHLLKKLLLPKLKARALQHYHGALSPGQQGAPLTEPPNGNLDKEAMNYELGYFLGLQKAFKNRQMLLGDTGEENLVPLKLTNHHGTKAALSDSGGPLTGYTSVSLPFHKLKSSPVHENLQSLFSRYGIQDPGFLKKVTKADEKDILQFAGKHNMDVFAERGDLKGISDYLSKREHISRPSKYEETNEGTSQRIKKDDIFAPPVVANEPDQQKEDDENPSAMVASGPNPLEDVPTPLHKIVSQAHHISSGELHDLLQGTGGHVNWDEISGLIGEDEDKMKEKAQQFDDKTPEVGTVYGEDTNVLTEKDFDGRPKKQEIDGEDIQNAGYGKEDHEVEKRTFSNLLKLATPNDYEQNKNELREVLKRIISRLSEIPESHKEKRLPLYEVPSYRRGYVSRTPLPNYYRSVYSDFPSYPVERLYRRNTIPRPSYVTKRANLPQQYSVSTVPVPGEGQMNEEYGYKSEQQKPITVETSGGVEAYALQKEDVSPVAKIENYMASPKEETYADAIAMLNRGSSIDDSLGDHMQAGFLQRFILPESPKLFRRSPLSRFRSPMLLKYRMRLRRSDSESKKRPQRSRKISTTKAPKNKQKKLKSKKYLKADAQEKSQKSKAAPEVTSKGSKKHEILRQSSMPFLSQLDNFVSPAVFESQSQNFFTQGGHDESKLFSQLNGNTVLISGPQSGVGTAAGKHFPGEHMNSPAYHHKKLPQNPKMLEQIISNPRMSSLRTDSITRGAGRSKLIGDRRISPALDIYQDHSVSSNGDTPMMEVQSLRASGAIQGKDSMKGFQNINGDMRNGAETEGQGTIEMSSNYEVVKAPSAGAEMEEGGMQSVNEDLVSQQNNRIMEEPKGDDNTGASAISVEDVSGETKQAISNTLDAMDKQGIAGAKSELESCCQIDPKAPCCDQNANVRLFNNHNQPPLMGETSFGQSVGGTPVYDTHPLSDHNLVQTMTKASQGLDEELVAGGATHHGLEDKVVNHVYLPDEDFDGIDWRKLHQPVHGLTGYDAHSKEDIQLLSDPFFSLGVGEPIGDHSKPSIVPQSLLDHPVNHFTKPANVVSPQTVVTTPAVTNAKDAAHAVLTADAVNTAKAITAAGAVHDIQGVAARAETSPSLQASNAVKASPVAAAAATAAAAAAAAASSNSGNNTSGTHEKQHHAYLQNVHDLHKEIVANAEQAASTVGTVIANDVKNTTHTHFIADVKDAALAKIKDNNAHAAELQQLANTIQSGNSKVAAKANSLVNNAAVVATENLEVPVTPRLTNVTSNIAGHVYSSEEMIHSLQDPHIKAFDDLEVEATKLEDLHHNSLHMGTYLNQDALHSMNPVSISKILSHGHVDANMHVPVVYGDWHTPAQDLEHGHDSYASHWNQVQLDSHPEQVDMTPMTPGGIQFTNPATADVHGFTGVGLATNAGVGTAGGAVGSAAGTAAGNAVGAGVGNVAGAGAGNAAASITAAANAASSNAAAANSAASNAASANAAISNAAAANAAVSNAAAAGMAANGNGGAASAGTANAVPNILGNAAASSGAGSAAKNAAASAAAAAAAVAAAANPANAAGKIEFGAGKTAANNIGNVGGVMKQGTVSASTAKAVSSSKDKVVKEGGQGGYPDLTDSDGDKRTTSIEESFDDDVSKKSDSKKTAKEKQEETGSGEGSGLDASTASTAEVEEGSKIQFNSTNNDDFQTAQDGQSQKEDTLDGKATMEFNQTNDSGPGEEETKSIENSPAVSSGPPEEPNVNADDKTTSLEVGNLKEAKVKNFTEGAVSVDNGDGYKSFVTNADAKNRSAKEKSPNNGEDEGLNTDNEAGTDGKGNEENSPEEKESEEANAESRTAKKASKHAEKGQTSAEVGENIASDEALRGNKTPVKVRRPSKTTKPRKKITLIRRKELLHKTGITKHHSHINRVNKVAAKVKVNKPAEKLSNSSEFFIGNRKNIKSDLKKEKDQSQEFFTQRNFGNKVDNVKVRKKNSSEFFLIKTNNLTNTDPANDEEIFTKGKDQTEFFKSPSLKSDKELDDFQLSESARKHLLPGDLEKLSKLHNMLSMAQINFLKKQEPVEENAITRMLGPVASRHQQVQNRLSREEVVRGKYRDAIHEALTQIEGVRKSLTSQEQQQLKGRQPKNEQYSKAIHEALKEVDSVKKSLMQTTTSSKALTNALAISNLANLLRESTNIFNKAYGVMHDTLPGSQVTGNMVTGGLLNPGASGVLINPAGPMNNSIKPKRPSNDIYAEIGTPATNEDESSEKKSLHTLRIANNFKPKNKGFRTIKEMKRGYIGKA